MFLLTLLSFLIIGILTLRYWIEFATDFLTNLSVKKGIGALMIGGSMWLLSVGQRSGSADRFVMYAGIALLIGGIGAVIIYYDMARDKVYGAGQHNELDTLTRAYERKEREATARQKEEVSEKSKD